MSAVFLGALGVSVGWGLFQIFMIITATAEWKNAPRSATIPLTVGLTCLLLATLLLSTWDAKAFDFV